jgi:hypothetical protein
MSRIVDMWRRGEVPGYSGLYRADDAARAIEIDGAALATFRVGEPFDLADRLAADPHEVAEVDESARARLPDGGGRSAAGKEPTGTRASSPGWTLRTSSSGWRTSSTGTIL